MGSHSIYVLEQPLRLATLVGLLRTLAKTKIAVRWTSRRVALPLHGSASLLLPALASAAVLPEVLEALAPADSFSSFTARSPFANCLRSGESTSLDGLSAHEPRLAMRRVGVDGGVIVGERMPAACRAVSVAASSPI